MSMADTIGLVFQQEGGMQKVLLFTVEFISAVSLGSIARCRAFSRSLRAAIEEPLKTQIGFEVVETSPNHWMMDMWCYNLQISKSEMQRALSTVKWMRVQPPLRRQLRSIPATPKEDVSGPTKRFTHREAQRRHMKSAKYTDPKSHWRRYPHRVVPRSV
jgi:hypothetical protein